MAVNSVSIQSARDAGFADVDRCDDPQARVRYLDLVAAETDYKSAAIAALALKPGDRVLDIGCGTGGDVRQLAEIVGPTGRVVGIDISATMVAEAVQRGQGSGQAATVEFRQGDIYQLPFHHRSFDATRADRVLQHLADPLAGLAEMRRVTRPGGQVCVIDPDFETLVVDVPNRALFRKVRGYYLDSCTGRYNGTQLFGLFHQAGLTEIRVAATAFNTLTEFTPVEQACHLRDMGVDARAAGAITDLEYAEWVDTLHRLESTDPCFAGIATTCVIGRKR